MYSRKSDLQEAVLDADGNKLKVALVTGFKNIQNVVNKIKRGKCDYHYIEIMACPSGMSFI
jgi:iron only hydrogenase large subunit-like protein